MATRSAGLIARLALAFALATGSSAQEAAAPAADARAAGPALRAALAELASDAERGRTALAEVERAYPIVADHAAQQRIASFAAAAEHARVRELAALFGAAHASSPLRGRVAALDADAAVALSDEAGARASYALARSAAEGREERARLALAIARSLERSAAHADAASAFVAIWRDDAPTGAAREAFAALEAQAPSATTGSGVIRDSDWALRGRQLFDAFWNEDALRACDRALAGGALEPARRSELAALRAELLFRDRRYAEAERAFAALPDSRENRFWRARSLARSGRSDEAKRAFEQLGEVRDDWGARALFLAGTLYEDDDVAKASERYRQALALATRAELRVEARWRLAWRAYLEQRFSDAARDLEALAREPSDPIEALRARYWQARALARAGDAAGASQLSALAREWSFTYYGQQSAARAPAGAGIAAEDATAAVSAEPERTNALGPGALLRARALLEAGLADDAGAEARALAPKARTQADRLELAAFLQDAGEYDAAQRVILDAYSVPLAAGPQGGEHDLWWAAYPQAFSAEVETAAAKAGIPAQLLYAVMREESGFRPDVLSVVGARGLVQIMPETGRQIARGLGAASYSPDELFVPERNLELGAAYLASLLARFEGRVSAAVASYNAGPEAVERWLTQNGALDDDEWIETIPYDQTRAYAKRVLRSFTIYQALY
jgi:soluble lytic murein transglycosylase